jgi:carbonic anhydrase/acetyltransferase-like protein (isoleucine patch superfamily)
MAIVPFGGVQPEIAPSAFIAPGAWVIGKVTIGELSSVFFNVVVRGDIQPITIGARSNLQEHVLVHTSHGLSPVTIGDQVTVGHRAIIHGCTIERCSLIGMGATILDDARIGEYSLIGAHTLITKGTIIPPRSLVMGTPGKIIRTLTDKELAELEASAGHYVTLASEYRLTLQQ